MPAFRKVASPATPREIGQFLRDKPDLRAAHAANRGHARLLARTAFYEVTSRCNLRCEGCFYFDGGFDRHEEETDTARWEAFFSAERERGVRYVYLVGAEPSLEPERLAAANRHFTHGLIGTNGTVRIDPAITFKLHLSVWGDPALDTQLRGAPAFEKALRNYRGEDRVLVLFTLSPKNLHQARTVLERCREHGLKATFNMFSPTQSYLSRLSAGAPPGSDPYFHASTRDDNLLWNADSLRAKHRMAEEMMEAFPDTLVYSRAYNDWVSQPGPLFDLDAEGRAMHCASRTGGALRLYHTDLQDRGVKCCTSDVDCSACRMYSGGLASRLRPSAADIASREAFGAYLDICKHLMGIYVYEPDWTRARAHEDA